MKRIVALTLAILMIAALFVGCSGNSSPDGVYRLKTINGKDLKSALAEELGSDADQVEALLKLAGIDKIEDYMTITLKTDGTVVASMMGEEETGTWKLDGEKMTLTINDEAMECTYKNGEITIDMNGESMVLAK